MNYMEILDELLGIAEDMASAELESCSMLSEMMGQPLRGEMGAAKSALVRVASIRKQLSSKVMN